MSRLTLFSRFLITITIVGGLFFAYRTMFNGERYQEVEVVGTTYTLVNITGSTMNQIVVLTTSLVLGGIIFGFFSYIYKKIND